MDKYEYQVCADQIKALIKEHRFQEAMDIADSIDWRRVKSFSMLCTVSEIYKVTKHYSEARDILLLAYERYPDRANVVYALCELAIKLEDISDSIEYYKEYVRLKPHDTNRYVLLYKIYDAQDVPIEEKISLLEEFKKAEYTEKWSYELALLYHKDGQETKCVETCDELVLWFGDGPYVRKALELKMQHAPLSKEQQRKYDGVYDAPKVLTGETEETVHIYETQSLNIYAQGGSPIDPEIPSETDAKPAPDVRPSTPSLEYAKPSASSPEYAKPTAPAKQSVQPESQGFTQDIKIAPYNNDKFSTINLQEELAKNMQEFYARENGNAVPSPFVKATEQLYEQSDAQFKNQLNKAGQPIQMQQPTQPQEPVQPTVTQMPTYEQNVLGSPRSRQQAQQAPQNAQYGQPAPQSVQYEQQIQQAPQNAQYGQPAPQYGYAPQPGYGNTAEQPPVEEQVPGQMEMGDFMKDWGEKRSTGEIRMQQGKARSKERTDDIMAQLAGVIPGVNENVVEDIQNKLRPEVKPVEEANKHEVLKDDKTGTVTRTTLSNPAFDKIADRKIDPRRRTESGARINGPVKPSITGEIPDFLPSGGPVMKGDVLPSGRKLTLDEEYGGNIAQIRREDAELVKRMTGELPEPEPEPEVEPVPEEPDYGEAEEIEEVEQPDLPEDEEESSESESAPSYSDSIPQYEVKKEQYEEEVEEEDTAEEIPTEAEAIKHGLTAPITYPYDVDDIGEVEELETIDQPDEVDDMLKTRPIPVEEIEARQRYEAGLEDDYSTTEEEPKNNGVRSYMTFDEKVMSRREFDDSEMAIFGRFEGIEILKAQIVDVMDDMSMEAHHGNVIVTGAEIYGRKGLAIDIVKAIQMLDSSFSGKVAKISGEALNKKNIPMTLAKLKNGALIVENAGGLTPITINAITDTLMADEGSIMVVLEGERETVNPLLNGCPEAKQVFDARIDIPDFTNDDLVAYAKGYAREQEYSIDEMGILAIYNRVGDLQTIDHVVSLDEMEDIIDGAIRHVDRKNVSHFMDVILAKRYDEEDYIVLREKDFLG